MRRLPFDTYAKIRALRRELALRRNVYARRVGRGEMLQATAKYEIAIFEEILNDYLVNRLVHEARESKQHESENGAAKGSAQRTG